MACCQLVGYITARQTPVRGFTPRAHAHDNDNDNDDVLSRCFRDANLTLDAIGLKHAFWRLIEHYWSRSFVTRLLLVAQVIKPQLPSPPARLPPLTA